MWSGFDSRTRCHLWVEFVVGSRPCSEGFSPGSPVFLPPQKPTLQIPFRCGNEGNGFVSLAVSVTSLNNIDCYFFYLLLGATIMVSKHCPIIGEHVVIIFVTQ